jgi:glycerol-3-phosphate dehydrogenase
MPNDLNRNLFIEKLQASKYWDVIVIGGGATGLGIALDAASRGYSTLLLEQSDFAKGTSSRSTKLVHGGVRYLAQGDIRLVYDALQERGLLLQNASHLVKRQAFVIPCYNWFSKIKYIIGLTIYDWLSGRFSFGKSRFLNRKEVRKLLPGIKEEGLVGGVEYFDGQFDDARLAINLAQSCAERGGVLLNYCKVTGLLKENEKVNGVEAVDVETGQQFKMQAKVVINATGVFVNDILQMDVPKSKPLVRPSQGVHLVLPKSFLPGDSALMIPKTTDGRVLFAVPWHDHVLIGTTDTPLDKHSLEPQALEDEINFILSTVRQYLTTPIEQKDVLSVFAGLRPLAHPQKDTHSTKEISRDHKLIVSDSGLITITGGKWTTYRKMAEETVDQAINTGGLHPEPCTTRDIRIHGCSLPSSNTHLSIYGSDQEKIEELIMNNPSLGKSLIDSLPYTEAEVIWAVRNEMARTVEDVLARRLRILFLDAKAAQDVAPKVADIMAVELKRNAEWIESQLRSFAVLTSQYLLKPYISKAPVEELEV